MAKSQVTRLLTVVLIGIVGSCAGQNFGSFLGQRPPFNILPFYPPPSAQTQPGISSFLPFFDNFISQISPPASANNQNNPNNPNPGQDNLPVTNGQGNNNNNNNNNGLASLFQHFTGLNRPNPNQNRRDGNSDINPVFAQGTVNPTENSGEKTETKPTAIDGTDTATIYTNLPFDLEQPEQIVVGNPLDEPNVSLSPEQTDSSESGEDEELEQMKDLKFYLPIINTQNSSVSLIPISQLFG